MTDHSIVDVHGANGTLDDGVILQGGRPKGQTQSDDTGNELGISEKIVEAGEKAAEGMEKARGLLSKIKLPAFLNTAKEKVGELFGKIAAPGEEGSKLAGVKDKGLMVGGGVLAADGARRILKKDADGKRHVLKGAVEAAAGAGLVAAGIAAHKAGKAEGQSVSAEGAEASPSGVGGLVSSAIGVVGKHTARLAAERGKAPGADGPAVGG